MPASIMLLTSFALVLGLVGCVSGFLAGLLGVGGGIVVVPVLYHVLAAFDVDMALRAHIAVGTSLATIIPTSVQSIRVACANGRQHPLRRRAADRLLQRDMGGDVNDLQPLGGKQHVGGF